jgi:hypothetical protein
MTVCRFCVHWGTRGIDLNAAHRRIRHDALFHRSSIDAARPCANVHRIRAMADCSDSLLDSTPAAAPAASRRIYRVRPLGDAWEMSFGDKGDTVIYATRIEALSCAFGGAWRHWVLRREPAGVQIEDEPQLAGRFGALGA